jgi:hypothetical protein
LFRNNRFCCFPPDFCFPPFIFRNVSPNGRQTRLRCAKKKLNRKRLCRKNLVELSRAGNSRWGKCGTIFAQRDNAWGVLRRVRQASGMVSEPRCNSNLREARKEVRWPRKQIDVDLALQVGFWLPSPESEPAVLSEEVWFQRMDHLTAMDPASLLMSPGRIHCKRICRTRLVTHLGIPQAAGTAWNPSHVQEATDASSRSLLR